MFSPVSRSARLVSLLAMMLPASMGLRAGVPPTPEEVRAALDEGRYADAQEEARALLASLPATESIATADALDLLAEALWRGGKSQAPETLEVAERALRMKSKLLPADDPGLAVTLNHLGHIHRRRGEFEEALASCQRALEIQEKALGPDAVPVARTLSNLAIIQRATGNYDLARPLYQRALRILEAHPEADPIRLAEVLNNYANLLSAEGEYNGAQEHLQRACRIIEDTLGPQHPKLATGLNNLALQHMRTGDFAGAKPLFERSLKIRQAKLEPDDPDIAQTETNLAILLWRMGDAEAAQPLFEKALALRIRVLGPDHPDTATVQQGLGFLLSRAGEYERAEELLSAALATREAKLGPDHPFVADSLNNLADLYRSEGRAAEGVPLSERALAIQERRFGPDSSILRLTLWSLASMLRETDPERARRLYERSLELFEAPASEEHPFRAAVMQDLASLEWMQGEPGAAIDRALRAEAIAREHSRTTSRQVSEREALGYEAGRAAPRDVALTALLSMPDPGARVAQVWDELVRSRALVLDEMAARQRAIHLSNDPTTVRLAQELEEARSRLVNLLFQPPLEGLQQDPVADARRTAEEAERALAARSAPFRRQQDRSRVGLQAVLKAMPKGTALVSYEFFARLLPPGSNLRPKPTELEPREDHYLAFVARNGQLSVVDLGAATEIDRLVTAWKAELSQPPSILPAVASRAEARYQAVGEQLRQAIWDPLVAALGDASMVFLVPDGHLHLVSWAALPARGGGYLVENGPPIQYVSAERDLVGEEHVAPPHGELALGGPDFDRGGPSAPSASAANGSAVCAALVGLRFEPLAGSRAEAEEVAALWREQGPTEPVTLLTGAAAGERAFKARAPGSRIIHLATHGFFLEGCAGATNPLLLSGVGLAGANRHERAADGEDGLLTALEIASLDLSGVEWVVLSGCDTGLGQVQPGEGILGLRRAFETAGVDTLIMSLWSVQDEAARDWMRFLYRARLGGATTVAAVRQASLDLIAMRREAHRSTHPFYWGAFVALGDWR